MTDSFVVHKWRVPGGRGFTSGQVNRLALQVQAAAPGLRFICVTDDSRGLSGDVQAAPLPSHPEIDRLTSLHGPRFPSCYRRLWLFSDDARAVLGDRFLASDLDVAVTGSLARITARTEDFVAWHDPAMTFAKYAGGLFLMTAGCRPQVWEGFDPELSPSLARGAGFNGSDQGWISYCLWRGEAEMGRAEGIWSAPWLPDDGLPEGAALVQFPGGAKPWTREAQALWPWLRDYWGQDALVP